MGTTPAGTYILTVVETNSEGCPGDPVSLTINLHNSPDQPVVDVEQPACGENVGSMTVNSPQSATISYSIDGGSNFQSSNVFENLAPGDYTVIAKNEFDCISEETSFTIDEILTVPGEPVVEITHPECGETEGSISITSPNDPDFTYSIDGGVNYSNETDFENLAPGDYEVVITHTDGCDSEVISVTINPAPIVPNDPEFDVAHPDCGETEGLISINAPQGANLEYSINGTNWQNETDFVVSAGTYEVQVRHTESNCSSESVSTTIETAPEIPETSPIQFN
ncbi:MAG: hypothetical protein ACQESK_02715 [Bacteroidota bacterium]